MQIVEMALVASLMTMLLFGMIEYCRLFFVQQLVFDAAREGARYAVVNTSDSTLTADTQTRVNQVLAALPKNVTISSIQVYRCDTTGANTGAATNAAFGTGIAVEIDGSYIPVLPTLLYFNSTVSFKIKSMMLSEAN
jgi:Flp pilus assembly protein TadG